MSELLDEWCCCEPLRQSDLEAFATRGVSPMALVRPDAIVRDRVVFHQAGGFEFTRWIDNPDGSTGALIFLVRSVIGDPIDLVAWAPGLDRLASWYGYAGLLGEDEALVPRLSIGLRVFRNPWRWLQAGRRGVVVVDIARARSALRAAAPLEADDLDHGRELRGALDEPPTSIVLKDRDAA